MVFVCERECGRWYLKFYEHAGCFPADSPPDPGLCVPLDSLKFDAFRRWVDAEADRAMTMEKAVKFLSRSLTPGTELVVRSQDQRP